MSISGHHKHVQGVKTWNKYINTHSSYSCLDVSVCRLSRPEMYQHTPFTPLFGRQHVQDANTWKVSTQLCVLKKHRCFQKVARL